MRGRAVGVVNAALSMLYYSQPGVDGMQKCQVAAPATYTCVANIMQQRLLLVIHRVNGAAVHC